MYSKVITVQLKTKGPNWGPIKGSTSWNSSTPHRWPELYFCAFLLFVLLRLSNGSRYFWMEISSIVIRIYMQLINETVDLFFLCFERVANTCVSMITEPPFLRQSVCLSVHLLLFQLRQVFEKIQQIKGLHCTEHLPYVITRWGWTRACIVVWVQLR